MPIASRTPHLRRSNLTLVLDQLRRRGPSTRSQLVVATGLTRSAIAGLVGELESLRLVIEEPSPPNGRPGRPSPVVRIDNRSVGVLAVEIFVDEIGAALIALDGTIIESVRAARPAARVDVVDTLSDLGGLVERLDGASAGIGRLLGCGVSVPGLVSDGDGLVVAAPNLGWVDVGLADKLVPIVGDLSVSVGNDANLGALAESRFGAGVGSDHMIFISGEVGVGGGLIVEGRPVSGHLGFAGEVGHMPVNPGGRRCRCGSIGCWETEVGERALLARVGLDPDGGRLGVAAVIGRASRGDDAALDALAIHARWLAIGIAGLVNVLDVDTIVLGGLFASVLPLIRERLDAELADRAHRAARRQVAVVGAALGDRAVIIGAAELAFADLLDDPAAVMALGVA